MPLSAANLEVAPLADLWTSKSGLPPLKVEVSPPIGSTMMRRLTSLDLDCLREREDLMFLRLGQDSLGRPAERSFFQFPRRAEICLVDEDRFDVASIPETEFGTTSSTTAAVAGRSPRRTSCSRMSLLLSPPAEAGSVEPQQQGSSQRDVYDAEPPPGYKRLKRVVRHGGSSGGTGPGFGKDATTTVTRATGAEGYTQHRHHHRRSALTKGQQHRQHQQQLPLGDGFSGDETKPRKRREKTDSSGGGGTLGSHRKRKRCETSPTRGTLEVVSLSQDELAAAQVNFALADDDAAAAAAVTSAPSVARTKDVRHMIPLRPSLELPNCKPAGMKNFWEFDPGEPLRLEEDLDDSMGDTVFEATGRSDEGEAIEGADLGEAVSPYTLPPLRHCRVKP